MDDHWEYAPFTGTEEMAAMIFGPPSAAFQQAGARDQPYLSFGPPAGSGPRQSYLVFDPPNKPAHTGKTGGRKTRRKSTRRKKRE